MSGAPRAPAAGGTRAAPAPRPTREAEPPPFRVLFVCTGNTCRSPMAEWIVRHEAARRGLSRLEAASAGTDALEGDAAAPLAGLVARERGVPAPPHRTTRLTAELVRGADLVVGMTAGHLAAAVSLDAGRPVALATDYLPPGHPELGAPVPDPIGGGRARYERTFDLLAECVRGLLDELGGRRREPGRTPEP